MDGLTGLTIRRVDATDALDHRAEFLALYAEIYADQIADPFHSIERFAERLDNWTRGVGFAAAIGYVDEQPVGYAYGRPLVAGAPWWNGLRTPVAPEDVTETGSRTLALSELMVVAKVRGTGAAKRIHDELMRDRVEERATLLVDSKHPRVRARYEEWGYRWLGQVVPFPDSPVFDAMVLALR